MFSCKGLACLEHFPEIPVQKRHAVFCGGPLCHILHQLMILIGADKQGGCEAVEALFFGRFCGLEQAHLVAFDAAVGNVFRHFPHERTQSVVVLLNEGKTDFLGVLPQAVSSGPVFGEGVDVGIIPEAGHIDVFTFQHLNALVGAGGAADMKQGIHRHS